ncbi:MAG TPA: IucA/IucC family C-terminal-domain containing protein [Acidimicrobiia bacterium]|jgi:ferric iron reductase protein FhuF|nr:IucA/IucC family C-terminal-domain containing protein [Acidimicrobiia bacterium]
MNTLGAGYREVPAGWLLQDGPALFRQVRAFGRAAGTDETAVATSLLCQAWAVAVTREAIASLVGARRVPDLASSNAVLLFNDDGRPAGVTLVSPRYAAVAGDDEAADDPLAEIVADDDALFAWTQRRLFDGHLAPLVEALHGLAPVGRRLLWGNVAAATAGGFAALSARPDLPFDPDHLLLEAPRLLDRPGSPTDGLVELFPVPHGDGTRLFVRRQTCCLRYRLPDAPPTCLSCRLLPERERRRRIGLRLTAEAEAETG